MDVPENIKNNQFKYIQALESGMYLQTTGVLKRQRNDGQVCLYCALGLAVLLTGHDKWDDSDVIEELLEDEYDIDTKHQMAIIHRNDLESQSFFEIARYLRHKWGFEK